jgi:pimeloyl-ACP methyl ester carboxylesterase
MRLDPRSRSGVLLLIAIGLVLVAVASITYARWPRSSPPTSAPSGDWQVSANGHTLRIRCQGTGSPTVIFDAGLGADSSAWDDVVVSSAGAGVRLCAYDRLGLGGSGLAPSTGRPIGEAIDDLHALLAAADVSPPYVLVSHSIAGIIDREFTRRYPSEVAGLVMVDTAPDDWNVHTKIDEFTSGAETFDIAEVTATLRAGDNLGARPVVVMLGATSDHIDPRPGFREYWQAAQHKLSTLSTNSMIVVAADSDHGILDSQPDLVSTAVGLVVTAVTTSQPLPACAESPALATHGGRCDEGPA